jgi:hypothetical protein
VVEVVEWVEGVEVVEEGIYQTFVYLIIHRLAPPGLDLGSSRKVSEVMLTEMCGGILLLFYYSKTLG